MPPPCLEILNTLSLSNDEHKIINTAYKTLHNLVAAYLSSLMSKLTMIDYVLGTEINLIQPFEVETLLVPIFQMRNSRSWAEMRKLLKEWLCQTLFTAEINTHS